ncbi:hypothetical protein [Ammoniphilus sp. YIM 78166]|uniref:hypothetical protein n=1 Tax=Ammoniphilus sp. YIM 78166 TaxID=1644106 RepID=UPI00106FE263|nr:hypothetical protein [Ammoniphilus sp. YIM 78166]
MLWVRTATVEDVDQMMQLDYRYYPQKWHIDLEAVKQTFRKGTQLARVVGTAEGIKGYYAALPLNKDAYEKVLCGELKEGELSEYVLHYRHHKEVYIYSVSIIVDIEDEQKKLYSKALVQDMPRFFNSLMEAGVSIKELGAIVVSKEGKQLLERIGYQHHGQILTYEGLEYPIYRAHVWSILDAIKTPITAF